MNGSTLLLYLLDTADASEDVKGNVLTNFFPNDDQASQKILDIAGVHNRLSTDEMTRKRLI